MGGCGGIKDGCQVTVGFLCVVCLSRFSLSVCRRGFQAELYTQPLKMELIQGSETSANYNLTPGKYPEENIQYSNHGESLKSRIFSMFKMCGNAPRLTVVNMLTHNRFFIQFYVVFNKFYGIYVQGMSSLAQLNIWAMVWFFFGKSCIVYRSDKAWV